MKIVLIFPSYQHKIFSENLRVVDEEFCHAPPLILGYVAAIIEKAGHEVSIIDAQINKYSKEDVLTLLNEVKPDMIGFRLETYHFSDTIEWIRYFKQMLNLPVLTGGLNYQFYPDETMMHKEIDYAILDDGFKSLPGLLKCLQNNESPVGIPGLAVRCDDTMVVTPASLEKHSFDDFPFPSRHLFENEKYGSFISKKKNFTIMVTSRGCTFDCSFCAISRLPYSERSPENVVDEMEQCYRDFSVREIDIFDAHFFANRKRALAICREIIRRKIVIDWTCRARIDSVDEELLTLAKKAGCRQISYGIESGDSAVLKKIDKRITVDQVREVIALNRRLGVQTMGFFMIGNPGETPASIERTIDFSRSLDLDFIQVCRTIAKPGTELEKVIKDKLGVNYWGDYILGKPFSGRLPTPWHNLAEEEVEAYTKRAYFRFYFRPKLIARLLVRIKSFAELRRYVMTGIKMLFCNKEDSNNVKP